MESQNIVNHINTIYVATQHGIRHRKHAWQPLWPAFRHGEPLSGGPDGCVGSTVLRFLNNFEQFWVILAHWLNTNNSI